MPGRIPDSLDEEGRRLVERLGGRWSGHAGLCRCPAHDDRRPSLSVRVGRTSLLLHCFAGCSAADILKSLRAAGQPVEAVTGSSRLRAASGAMREAERSRAAAVRLWAAARPIAGTPVERYLEGRGLTAGASLTCFRPAMIAAVRDGGGIGAIHRTFLDPRRSIPAPIDEPRCGLGRFGSAAVRLGGVASRLGLAEGIETALSASALFGLPCWATLGTERFRLVTLPPEVTELVLFLDNDAGGRRAEALARETFAHLPIETHYPRRAGADWNDVLRAMIRRRER
jgi:hypothetical protein